MQYKIETITTPEQIILVVKGKTKHEDAGVAIGEAIEKVGNYLERLNQSPTGAPLTRILSIQNDILEFEAGFPVPQGTLSNSEVYLTKIPEALVATTVHVGSQETSVLAYQALHAWMSKNNKSVAGAPWEVYLTDETILPEQAQMQIYYPIK